MNTKISWDRCPHRPATKRIVSLILSLAMLFSLTTGLDFSAFAEATSGSCGENVTWKLDTNAGVLTISGDGPMSDYSNVDKIPWYSNREYIKSVNISSSVTSIGNEVFYNCSGLKSITIPNSVTSIGNSAFSYCESLTGITIPKSVTSIGSTVFFNCSSLTDINVAFENENYSSKDGVLFNKERTRLIQYPIGNARKSYLVPNSVTELDILPFFNCSSLTAIDVAFDNENFSSKDGVLFNKKQTVLIQYPIGNTRKSYSVPDTVTYLVCAELFGKNLISLFIPITVTNIDMAFANDFSDCGLRDIYFGGTETEWQNIKYLQGLVHFKYPDTITIHYNSSGIVNNKSFIIGINSNSFVHSDSDKYFSNAGFKNVKNYSVSKQYYNKLVAGCSDSEKKKIKKEMASKWEGSCYGIAATMGLAYLNRLPIVNNSVSGNYFDMNFPYQNKDFLDAVNYYQLSQYLNKYNKKVRTYNRPRFSNLWNLTENGDYDSLKLFLKDMVYYASNEEVLQLCYGHDFSGHSILITDCVKNTNGSYTLKVFDENTVDDYASSNKNNQGHFDYITISSDYSEFTYDEEKINYENYDYLQFVTFDNYYDSISKSKAYYKEDNNVTNISFSAKENFAIEANGKTLEYDGNEFSGDLIVYSITPHVNDGETTYTLEIENSEEINYVSNCDASSIEVISNDSFLSFNGENIDSANFDLSNSTLNVEGNDAVVNTFTDFGDDLININAEINGDIEISFDNNDVNVDSDNNIENITVNTITDDGVIEIANNENGSNILIKNDENIYIDGQHICNNESSIWKTLDNYCVKYCTVCNKILVKLPFSDLNKYVSYGDYVTYTSVNNSFLKGTNPPYFTEFSPTASITRAMFVTILYRMAGEPYANSNPYSNSPFTDIKDKSVYYYDAACWALDKGITNQLTFKPFDNVTREQTASFLFRYADDTNNLGSSEYKNVDLSKYSDSINISVWAKEAMQWANYNGMITGTQQGTANPQGATQRIHVTKILYGFGKVCNIGNFE